MLYAVSQQKKGISVPLARNKYTQTAGYPSFLLPCGCPHIPSVTKSCPVPLLYQDSENLVKENMPQSCASLCAGSHGQGRRGTGAGSRGETGAGSRGETGAGQKNSLDPSGLCRPREERTRFSPLIHFISAVKGKSRLRKPDEQRFHLLQPVFWLFCRPYCRQIPLHKSALAMRGENLVLSSLEAMVLNKNRRISRSRAQPCSLVCGLAS